MVSSLLSNWLTLPLNTNARLPSADEITNPRLKILHWKLFPYVFQKMATFIKLQSLVDSI